MSSKLIDPVLLDNLPVPWLRLPGEPDGSYESFLAFWRLGQGRTLGKAAASVGLATSTVSKYSSTWLFAERLRRCVNFAATQEFADWIARRIDARERALQIGIEFQELARQAVSQIDPADLSARDAATAARTGQALIDRALFPEGQDWNQDTIQTLIRQLGLARQSGKFVDMVVTRLQARVT